ncbi:hypothetical protein [Saccharopolyspora rosea]|uniref:hypothetical protein n=1 Tax=Saccharopolyspora rosea TaxID=524884 RepID=UPI0021D8B747|nr:hypothetical protein [Saccharopolyspora rosea]
MRPADLLLRPLAILAAAVVVALALAAVVLWRAVLPAVLITALALACGMARTLALGAFVVTGGLRAVMLALERAGHAIPAPRLRRRMPAVPAARQ